MAALVPQYRLGLGPSWRTGPNPRKVCSAALQLQWQLLRLCRRASMGLRWRCEGRRDMWARWWVSWGLLQWGLPVEEGPEAKIREQPL